MAGRIPQQFIDDLISRVDIVDVVDSRVPLKKKGREFVACCPFHNEKTPSFTVSPEKQFYHCFGCGAHGTAISFLMEYEHLDFLEAVQELANRVGLELPERGGDDKPVVNNAPLYELQGQAERFYRQQLRQHPQAPRAIDYLKGRGLSGQIAAEYGIGYAPPGWDNLHRALGGEKRREDRLVEVGLLIENDEGRRYDRFRDRIMFPIRDSRGRIVGFGGRVLGDDKPKYLNSPESAIFHKGQELYGLYEARQALREIPRLLVVEGYMDVVSLAQFGVRNAVATLGTATTPEHLQRLFRVTKEVVFCFDGDQAGRKAAWRGLENSLPLMREGRQIRFMFLPEGEDPDSLIRRIGAERFAAETANAVPLSTFFFQQLEQQTDMGSLDGRARLVEQAKPLLAKLPVGAFRQLMTDRLAEVVGMAAERMQQVLQEGPRGATPPAPTAPPARRPRPRQDAASVPSPVRHAIALLLQAPGLAALAGDFGRFSQLRTPGVRLLMEILEFLQDNPNISTGALLEHWRDTEAGRALFRLAGRDPIPGDNEALEAEFRGALELLDREQERQRREMLQNKPFKALSATEKLELQQLLKRMAEKADSPR